MAHFNDFKIQCVTSLLGAPMAMKYLEAALSSSFLNPFARCNQMRRQCREPWGDEVPLGFHGWVEKWKGNSCYVWVSRHREGWQVSSSHTECVQKLQWLQTFPAGLLNSIKEEASWNHSLHCAWLVPGEWHTEKNFSGKFLIISNH